MLAYPKETSSARRTNRSAACSAGVSEYVPSPSNPNLVKLAYGKLIRVICKGSEINDLIASVDHSRVCRDAHPARKAELPGISHVETEGLRREAWKKFFPPTRAGDPAVIRVSELALSTLWPRESMNESVVGRAALQSDRDRRRRGYDGTGDNRKRRRAWHCRGHGPSQPSRVGVIFSPALQIDQENLSFHKFDRFYRLRWKGDNPVGSASGDIPFGVLRAGG